MKTQTRRTHLSIEERSFIMSEQLRGSSCRWIAAQLGRSPSTISRELRRGVATESTTYQARFAQQGGPEYLGRYVKWHRSGHGRINRNNEF